MKSSSVSTDHLFVFHSINNDITCPFADDLKIVASQFRRLHTTFIQAAWRRHMKKKLEESLREEENRLQDALAKAGVSSPSLGATIYASRFAANTPRSGMRKVPERLPAMLLQKPAEPDFTAEEQ
ncbi:hypothetical protein ACFXTI_040249 [Malus domestica]